MNIQEIEKSYDSSTYEYMWDSLLDCPSYVLAQMVLESMTKESLDSWAKAIKEEG